MENVQMDILFGLAAALCLGTSDFLARFATRHAGTYRTLFFMQVIGFVSLSLFLFATGAWTQINFVRDRQAWGWTAVDALLDTASIFALYRAFETGLLMVVSPVASAYPAVTVALSVLSGEQVTFLSLVGIVAILIGVMLAQTVFVPQMTKKPAGPLGPVEAQSFPLKRVPSWMYWTLAASIGFGIYYWLLGFAVTPILGGITPNWLIRLVPLCLLAPFSAMTRQNLRIPRGSVWVVIVGVGLLDSAGGVLSLLGLTTEHVAVVSTLVSLYSVATIVLAQIFLKERLRWSQWIGVLLILGGVAILSA
jgi:uncharacterized membrane protein